MNKKIALDSNIFIYFFEPNSPYHAELTPFFRALQKKKIHAYCSVVIWTEILPPIFQINNQEAIARYCNLDDESFAITFTLVTKSIAIKAAQIRAQYRFRTPDAIHLATALENNVEYFLTNDQRLNSFSELRIKSLGR